MDKLIKSETGLGKGNATFDRLQGCHDQGNVMGKEFGKCQGILQEVKISEK